MPPFSLAQPTYLPATTITTANEQKAYYYCLLKCNNIEICFTRGSQEKYGSDGKELDVWNNLEVRKQNDAAQKK